MLVVVEYRDLHPLPELPFDIEALRCLDVFKVDAAERVLECGDHFDKFVGVAFVDLDVEDVDAGELLEEHRLAFHHRLGRQRPDRAQAEHRGAVGDHAYEVASRGEVDRFARIAHDFLAGRRHARCIGQREVALVGELLGRQDRDLARARQAVVFQRAFLQLVFQCRLLAIGGRPTFSL